MEETYKIGRIGKPHGVRGEVQMQFTDDVFDRTDADYVFLEIDGLQVPFFIEEYRFRSDSLVLMKFEDVDTADRARELTGCNVFFPRKHSVDEETSISWAEIVGYHVIDRSNGNILGTINSVDDSTMNVLITITDDRGDERLIPFSEELIKDINKAGKTITMEIPDGLLDI